MSDAINVDRSDSEAFKWRQQDSSKRITNGDAETWFKRSKLENAFGVGAFNHDNLIGFLKR